MSLSRQDDELLTTAQAAEMIGIKHDTLEQWRYQGKGPRFIKSSPTRRGSVRYRRSDVLAWQDQNTFANTSQYKVGKNGKVLPPWEPGSTPPTPGATPPDKSASCPPSAGKA